MGAAIPNGESQTMSAKHQWLHREIDEWIRVGLVDLPLAERLRARYPTEARAGRSLALIGFAVLGVLLLGGGLILLLAHNWADWSRPVRTAVALAPLILAQALALFGAATGRSASGWREPLGVFWTLSIGGAIAMVSQIYHLAGEYDSFMMTWLLLALPVIYLMRSALSGVIYLALVVAWASPHAGELPRALLVWPLALAVVPFLVARRNAAQTYTPSAALLRWALTLALGAGVGLTLTRALPGLWMVLYASLFSFYFLADGLLHRDAPSRWHRPMRLIGSTGCVALSLILTYEWPWREIGWRHWAESRPVWHHLLDAGSALALMGGAVACGMMQRRTLTGPERYPAIFFLVALAGFAITAHGGLTLAALVLFNGFVFVYGLALVLDGVRRGALGDVNAGLGLMALVIVLRFFDSGLPMLARGLVFVGLGAVFLAVNVILSTRQRRST